MIRKGRTREMTEIPSASLADIAFLLLIFFLVTTTIDVDTGIGLVLPPAPDENQEPPPIKQRNLLKILVSTQGLILIDGKEATIDQVKEKVINFITNPTQNQELSESPQKAIVSIKTQQKTPYRIYISMLDEVMAAYKDIRNTYSLQNFGSPFDKLKSESPAHEATRKAYPKKISIAEPDET